jgi:hypothetical protein
MKERWGDVGCVVRLAERGIVVAFGLGAAAATTGWKAVAAYAPTVMDLAFKLYQGSKKSEADMAVPSPIAAGSTQIDANRLSASISDIECSLKTLNGQMIDAGLLLTKLAESNATLTQEVKTQRGWILALSILAAFGFALGVISLLLALNR